MSDGVPTISFIVSQLPQKLQRRFESLGGYIRGLIEEERQRLGKDINLTSENIQLIQLAALLYSLESFFRAGSSSARGAAATFEQFQIPGFQVGRTTFTSTSYSTQLGDVLADRLQNTIRNSRLGVVISNSATMRDLITTMIREMSDD